MCLVGIALANSQSLLLWIAILTVPFLAHGHLADATAYEAAPLSQRWREHPEVELIPPLAGATYMESLFSSKFIILRRSVTLT